MIGSLAWDKTRVLGGSFSRGGRTLVVRNLYSKLVGRMIKMAQIMQIRMIISQVAKTGKNYK